MARPAKPDDSAALEAAKAEVLAELDECRAGIEQADTALTRLYERRLTAYKRGRELGITQRAMADRAGVTEVAVIQALRKERNKAASA